MIRNKELQKKIVDLAFLPEFDMRMYYGNGAAGGVYGDDIMLAHPLIINKKPVDRIVKVVSKVIPIVCNGIATKN